MDEICVQKRTQISSNVKKPEIVYKSTVKNMGHPGKIKSGMTHVLKFFLFDFENWNIARADRVFLTLDFHNFWLVAEIQQNRVFPTPDVEYRSILFQARVYPGLA